MRTRCAPPRRCQGCLMTSATLPEMWAISSASKWATPQHGRIGKRLQLPAPPRELQPMCCTPCLCRATVCSSSFSSTLVSAAAGRPCCFMQLPVEGKGARLLAWQRGDPRRVPRACFCLLHLPLNCCRAPPRMQSTMPPAQLRTPPARLLKQSAAGSARTASWGAVQAAATCRRQCK